AGNFARHSDSVALQPVADAWMCDEDLACVSIAKRVGNAFSSRNSGRFAWKIKAFSHCKASTRGKMSVLGDLLDED
ncbi:MAG: hypothetical protein ACKO6H_08860, partial [Betaproteobacteria bacterium]